MAAVQVRESVKKVMIEALIDFGFEPTEITTDVSLVDLGVSSLDVVELIQIVRHQFGVELQGQEMAQCRTLDDIITLISARTGPADDG